MPQAGVLFNIVFFVVFSLALLQGWSMPLAARLLHLVEPNDPKVKSPIDLQHAEGLRTESLDFILPNRSALTGKALVDLNLPPDTAIVLICRKNEYLIPAGSTTLEEGDDINIITHPRNINKVNQIFTPIREEQSPEAL